ncbi:hypothetical protein TSUD_168840 [Trifolium subterraneum]|nr:hypothetical protein TSUD_168840 [Trifolium subterraneum]
MRSLNIPHDYATFAVALKACTGIEDYGLGFQVHCLAIQMGFENDVVTGTALVDMYSTCKKLDHAFRIFVELPERNPVCWSAVIAGYVRNDRFIEGLKLYKAMLKEGMGVSQSTFASAFRACAGLSAFEFGTQLHAYALKTNFGYDSIVGTATLDMYAKCDRMSDARKLFNSFPKPTRQSHNAIIVGYARQDQGVEALEIFRSLQKSYLGFDEISFSGALTACSAIKGHLEDWFVGSAMIGMYCKCGMLVEAEKIHERLEEKTTVSWNSIISGFSSQKQDEMKWDGYVPEIDDFLLDEEVEEQDPYEGHKTAMCSVR